MKKWLILVLLLICFGVGVGHNRAEAHPGRTDSSGGHTCRTNCEKWGLRYGQYHYHSSSRSAPPKADFTANVPASEDNKVWPIAAAGVLGVAAFLAWRSRRK